MTDALRWVAHSLAWGALVGCLFGPVAHAGEAQDAVDRTSAPPALAAAMTVESSDAVLSAALMAARADRRPERLDAIALRYQQLGILDKAMDYYAESLKKRPSGLAALDGAARIWRDWGQLGPALGSAYRAVHASPKSPEAWNTLGTVLHAAGHLPAASQAYLRARALDQGAAYIAVNLCYVAFLQGDEARAVTECSRAAESESARVAALNNLALVHAATGQWSRALHSFMAAARDEAAAQYNLGIALLADRDYEASAQAFERAWRARPGFRAAQIRAAFARSRAPVVAEGSDASR